MLANRSGGGRALAFGRQALTTDAQEPCSVRRDLFRARCKNELEDPKSQRAQANELSRRLVKGTVEGMSVIVIRTHKSV